MLNHSDLIKHEYDNRRLSFLRDGYCQRIDYRTRNLWYCKLKHMANGNLIELKVNMSAGTLEQKTNHLVTFLLTR